MKTHRALFLAVAVILLFAAGAVLAEPPAKFPRVESFGMYDWKRISAADNNVVKAAPGLLSGISVNSVTTSGTITVYDNTVCATPADNSAVIAVAAAPFPGQVLLPQGVYFKTGLCVNTGSGSNMDLTAGYR
ncbi:MAG TPA: hypothetical protein PKV70_07925 [Thermodesulfobacteriota bacterium]|nr:hypothetical protein [Thermodesulfobacteriota bacterium]HQU14163.1 hypothetical protein [Thermodesulfobacteriota bacterium]